MSHIWSLLCFLIGTSYAAEVCFNELGCFNDLPPWGGTAQRPVSVLPWQPDQIGTRFLLFTQKNRYYQEIKTDQTIHASNYGGKRKTRFIVPGYLKKDDEDWPQEMCKVMVKLENVNCIAVEWKKGVKTQYVQAANNARVLGAQVAFMITFLKANFKQKSDKFHIIGHSLGAHAAGDAGSRTAGLARITGLDPTEPYFQDTDASVRLDTSDAAFVDVIHTDGLPFKSKLGLDPIDVIHTDGLLFKSKLGLGMSQSMGHIDFYPNGGELMPGCSANKGYPSDLDAIWEGTKKFDACNHARAYEYYSESIIKRQGFVAYPCSNEDSFAATFLRRAVEEGLARDSPHSILGWEKKGKCFPCGDDTCPLMGYYADRFTVTDGISETKYFLNTGSSEPFGRYSYKVKLTLDGPSWPNPGFMYVALAGDNDSTKEYKLHSGTMKPGRTYEVLIDAEVDIGDATEVKFRWNNHILNPLRPKYGASKVELQREKTTRLSSSAE